MIKKNDEKKVSFIYKWYIFYNTAQPIFNRHIDNENYLHAFL